MQPTFTTEELAAAAEQQLTDSKKALRYYCVATPLVAAWCAKGWYDYRQQTTQTQGAMTPAPSSETGVIGEDMPLFSTVYTAVLVMGAYRSIIAKKQAEKALSLLPRQHKNNVANLTL